MVQDGTLRDESQEKTKSRQSGTGKIISTWGISWHRLGRNWRNSETDRGSEGDERRRSMTSKARTRIPRIHGNRDDDMGKTRKRAEALRKWYRARFIHRHSSFPQHGTLLGAHIRHASKPRGKWAVTLHRQTGSSNTSCNRRR